MAERLGWTDVATHVNSGNLVFTAAGTVAELEAALAAEVRAYFGKDIQVLVLTADEWVGAVERCPYRPTEEKFVHLEVHRHPLPEAAATALAEAAAAADDGTEVTVDGRWLYVHTPHGLSRSVAFNGFPAPGAEGRPRHRPQPELVAEDRGAAARVRRRPPRA